MQEIPINEIKIIKYKHHVNTFYAINFHEKLQQYFIARSKVAAELRQERKNKTQLNATNSTKKENPGFD